MFATMSQAEQQILTSLQSSEATLRQEIVQLKQILQAQADAAAAGATGGRGSDWYKGGKGGDWHSEDGAWEKGWFPRVVLSQKYSQRVDKFEGKPANSNPGFSI